MKAISAKQQRELLKVLTGVHGRGITNLNVDPQFKEFLNGNVATVQIGIFQLRRNDEAGTRFSVSLPESKDSETVEYHIGATSVFVTGRQEIEFFVHA